MIHLTWDPHVAAGIAVSGLLVGFFIGPQAWPLRLVAKERPPVALATILALTIWAAFFGSLAAFRLASGRVAELEATVLYLVFIAAGACGLWIRSRFIR